MNNPLANSRRRTAGITPRYFYRQFVMKPSLARGFTLIEAVLTIVITGILSGMVAVFINAPVESYIDTVGRANLTDAADGALRRIARDLSAALPNSLRNNTSTAIESCVEFLPVVGGGRYRVTQSITQTGDILDFSAVDASFDVLASTNLPTFSLGASYYAVIYNLGIPGADAYEYNTSTPLNNIRAAITNTAISSNVKLNPSNQFPFESPGKRFHVIPNHSVVYSCHNGQLLRSTRDLTNSSLAQLDNCPGTGDVLVNNVSNCTFNYTPAVSQRNGQLTMRLGLTQLGESIQLYQEVHINNVP